MTVTTVRKNKPIGDQMAPLSFVLAPEARWNVDCHVATLPRPWLEAFRQTWRAHPGYREGRYLPTRRLVELLIGVEPSLLYVNSNPESDAFIVASQTPDALVLTTAIASWATTQLSVGADGPDWYTALDPAELVFEQRSINLFDYGQYPNNTAAPSPWMFDALPTFLASKVTAAGLTLLGKPRTLILGPPQSDGRRDAVLWPPIALSDARAGESLATAKITFHIETDPNDPHPHIHADLSTSRFPLMPVTYVPARGDGPPSASVWLHAPDGFLRPTAPHTLLAATATQAPVRGGGRRWQWDPGLAGTLARLTHLAFPDPEKVFAQPASAWNEGSIRTLILYSEGTKSAAADQDEPSGPDAVKTRSLLHAANTGLVPGDHIAVHNQLAAQFAALGIIPHPSCRRVGPRTTRKSRTPNDATTVYQLELRTNSTVTQDAVLATLTHHMKLQRQDGPGEITFTGDTTIKVRLEPAGILAGPVPRPPDKRENDTLLLGRHANLITQSLGPSPEPVATILELENADYFARTRQLDPKPALKKGFARSGRRLQCLTPAKPFTPPKSWPEDSKRKKPEPYPGTEFAPGTIHRVSAAISDALRQLGRVSTYDTPLALPDLEHIAIGMHSVSGALVPLVIRMMPGEHPIAHLAGTGPGNAVSVPYSDLPAALAAGKGRIRRSPHQETQLAQFLTNALGIGATGPRETHDRIVYVRAGAFRSRGWDWLQNKHIQPDRLVLPGLDLDKVAEPQTLTPENCPGLRIVRVRDRSSTMEVARGFAADPENHSVRISGLFQRSERLFSSINPRSDQMQTPLGVTKLDPDLTSNLTAQVGNPVPLEIFTAFLQPGDEPHDYALFISGLRRSHLHTDQATELPGLLHLCKLAAEYL
jgi:hypothetical protein